jgi:hypothetical protein
MQEPGIHVIMLDARSGRDPTHAEHGACLGGATRYTRAGIFKLLWSPGIDSREWIPPAYVLCSLVGRYDNPIPTWFLAPIDCLKLLAQTVYIEDSANQRILNDL